MTAVEWLQEKQKVILNLVKSGEFDIEDFEYNNTLYVNQAKEIEKEQKKFIFECGRNFQLTGEGTFEEVYNETFKSE